MAAAQTLVDHIEDNFGEMQQSWSASPNDQEHSFQVVRCAGKIMDTEVFTTLGLSNHPMRQSLALNGKPIRQELLTPIFESARAASVPNALTTLAANALQHSRAFLRGEVIDWKRPIFTDLPYSGFYPALPVFVEDDAAAVFSRSDGEDIALVWMIPVLEQEMNFIKVRGWSRFEDRIIELGIDMVELNRPLVY
jgi:hypothetical protein